MDVMVLKTQQWLNATYAGRPGHTPVTEDGQTGWKTVYGLLHALQIELGLNQTADNFGAGTASRFTARWPSGISQQSQGDTSTSNVYAIIQGALWCKGYSTGFNEITHNFYGGTGAAVSQLRTDMGLTSEAVVDVEIMKALLSMNQFVLLSDLGGRYPIREAQQRINRDFRDYTGLIPTDGLYGRELNKALIQILQKLEGFTPAEAIGYFGAGTRSRLKVITRLTAPIYPEWVWLGTAALVCNGFASQAVNFWDPNLRNNLARFQKEYGISITKVFDVGTWMSLLTTTGDPQRSSIACDTRFEATDELISHLKADGYQIIGRYLTEPGQDGLSPAQYFKAIRPGELERITAAGMRFFPIYQEYGTKLTHFTPENGARHGREAAQAARRLNIPSTHIYFAVDFDALDAEATSHLIPYFRAVATTLEGYRVGVYGSRNVCTRIINAGYASSAFVSGMSSGFSGNLGFSLPTQWNYDQFTEIRGYRGKWDLDKVAYSGRHPAVAQLVPSQDPSPSVDYPSLGAVDLIWHLEKRFEELRAEGRVGTDYIGTANPYAPPIAIRVETWRAILNYLSQRYLHDGGSLSTINWTISAEQFRGADAAVLEKDPTASQVIAALNR